MTELSEDIIEELVRQKLEGKSYTHIKNDLRDRGLNEAEIRESIKKIDEKVLLTEIGKRYLTKSRQLYHIGMFLAIFGLILTIASNRFILTQLPKYVIYIPFFAGLLLMFFGRMSNRKQPDLHKKGPGRIERKRPYK